MGSLSASPAKSLSLLKLSDKFVSLSLNPSTSNVSLMSRFPFKSPVPTLSKFNNPSFSNMFNNPSFSKSHTNNPFNRLGLPLCRLPSLTLPPPLSPTGVLTWVSTPVLTPASTPSLTLPPPLSLATTGVSTQALTPASVDLPPLSQLPPPTKSDPWQLQLAG